MENPVSFHRAARREFDDAFDWYVVRSHGAALGFASEVDQTVERILADPGRFGKTFARCQYCKLHRYPYCVIYRRSEGSILVVAVAHAKRRPGYWRRRM